MKKTFNKKISSILITGGSGMVGSSIGFGMKPGLEELDVTDFLSVRRFVMRYRPKVIIHLAALVDMAECERNLARAYEVNVIGTYNVSRAAREFGCHLIYLSTCAVFDGKKKGPYATSDIPDPLGVYGRTKYIGELVVRDMVPGSLVVRTGWLFGGGSAPDKKFVGLRLREFMREDLRVKSVSTRFGSPTYVPDLLKAVEKLIKKRRKGVVHIVNKGIASYFEISETIREFGGFRSKVVKVGREKVENKSVPRGIMEGLRSSVLLRSWRSALKEYVSLVLENAEFQAGPCQQK